jgi:hypothetical protein
MSNTSSPLALVVAAITKNVIIHTMFFVVINHYGKQHKKDE